ncbi:hypothetical protein RSAG8_13512, partial [Rhizoctonia solani AG-8 WAC10335]
MIKRRPPPARLPPLFTAEISPEGLRHHPNGLMMTREGRFGCRGLSIVSLILSTPPPSPPSEGATLSLPACLCSFPTAHSYLLPRLRCLCHTGL